MKNKEAPMPKTTPAPLASPLAAATPSEGVVGPGPKNFRNHPDIENFFRFIYENDLREEALEILDEVLVKRAEKKLKKLNA